ncbi:hypothetical protein ZIOFF_056051 [Zingiber officinale]|uniref:Malectin-like domain-containing protein n=1 Tax=Zingiber officinale TaxID=94328 RepID=A0A8J5FIH8_ZINOF|nr:hypothetical protein ZIOFF_056051 [Zingiber officinale]
MLYLQVNQPRIKILGKSNLLVRNYDFKNSPFVQFDLYLGVNLWKTINLTLPSKDILTETVSEATVEAISVCLANTGHGTPFISDLIRSEPCSNFSVSSSQLLHRFGQLA